MTLNLPRDTEAIEELFRPSCKVVAFYDKLEQPDTCLNFDAGIMATDRARMQQRVAVASTPFVSAARKQNREGGRPSLQEVFRLYKSVERQRVVKPNVVRCNGSGTRGVKALKVTAYALQKAEREKRKDKEVILDLMAAAWGIPEVEHNRSQLDAGTCTRPTTA